MNAISWLEIAILGIVFGAIGQGARAIVGLKKLSDYADDSSPMLTLVDGMRLLISFGIGGVAGALAAITLITDMQTIKPEQLFAIATAGYAGSDFIEGFISRISSQTPGAPVPHTVAADGIDDAVG